MRSGHAPLRNCHRCCKRKEEDATHDARCICLPHPAYHGHRADDSISTTVIESTWCNRQRSIESILIFSPTSKAELRASAACPFCIFTNRTVPTWRLSRCELIKYMSEKTWVSPEQYEEQQLLPPPPTFTPNNVLKHDLPPARYGHIQAYKNRQHNILGAQR
jgi:hypothetical protein